MNTIELQGDISQEQYQMAVRVLKAINIKVKEDNPFTSVSSIVPELTEEDIKALEQSKKEDEQGLHIASSEVHKKALEICMK
ncbi:MAG: hypothetical protein KGV59_05115 [Tenacibaculum sp.]|nr:hypothetical protein [Tenacibaculum sp.]